MFFTSRVENMLSQGWLGGFGDEAARGRSDLKRGGGEFIGGLVHTGHCGG